ncbi:ABC-F family ATP-binding cassette domain-containing protein [Klugiella xanthotipulae]|uniref:ATPase subunit of ABC transporter with duplicated ATPase domains n=1 Tax=Klugiella xanthotipulae TaxID=244735 RepID=A0A543I690_9MICO|nr:ABC-F family ATP-binding cassette domain-containing protein [Klugiella xanthotipulae]TQM66094.1 ATPase subunit of ABC transporter with duplicated ATPase domains [Klugiella xanthotipulae]
MSTPQSSSIILNTLGLTRPDGSVALRNITAVFGLGRTGLIGHNGSGKSTLLRLIAGERAPTSGSITLSGEVGYLPQTLTLDRDTTAADLLGVRHKIDALRAIESGDTSVTHVDTLGEEWDIETRAGAALRSVGLGAGDLDRTVGRLSGGETVLLAIAGLRLRASPISLLDEPTNNLDRDARERLADMVRSWRGTLVTVSHDTALLELMDSTAELHDGQLTVYGGPYSAYREHLAREQEAARQSVRTAEQALTREKRQQIKTETMLARRARTGRAVQESRSEPRIVMGRRASAAQVSSGKLRANSTHRVQDARAGVNTAAARLRADEQIHIDLPDPHIPSGRHLAELRGLNRSFIVQGRERIAITGPNGVGKSTLLDTLVQPVTARRGRASAVAHTERVGYLTQRLDTLNPLASVLDSVQDAAPTVTPGELRNRLARFLIRGDAVERPVHTLSGGERFRVALACVLLADPPPQLLVLDEPTNNLDLGSVDQLVAALGSYRGGLIVVSHDDAFLGRLGIDRRLALSAAGELVEVTE